MRDKVGAIRNYAKAAGLGRDTFNAAAEIRLRAERKAGELLAEMELQHGGPKKKMNCHDVSPLLEELGISHTQSSRWQKLAAVHVNRFDSYMSITQASDDRDITRAGLFAFAKKLDLTTDEKPAVYDDEAHDQLGNVVPDEAARRL